MGKSVQKISFTSRDEIFVSSRLTDIREEFGIRKIALAKLLDISPSLITSYENGGPPPPYHTLSKMATIFDVNISYFYKPIYYKKLSPVLFRDLSTTKPVDRERAKVYLKWSVEVERHLSKYAEFPKVTVPGLDLPKNPELISDSDIESAAKFLRGYWGIGSLPITNVTRILERNGIILSDIDIEADSIDALMTTDENNRFFILNNSAKQSSVRKRFTTLHDFAHGLMHSEIDERLLEVKSYKAMLENQAHKFASAMLLPKDSFLDDIYGISLKSLSIAKPRWKVSVGAMIFRLYYLGVIDSHRKEALLKDWGRRGWRTKEPFDSDIPQEKPVLLRKAFELANSHFGVTGSDLAQEIDLPKRGVAEIIGVDKSDLMSESGLVVPKNQTI